MNINDAKHFIKKFFFTGQSMELRSGPGLGKSSVVEQALAELSIEAGRPFGMVVAMMAGYDAPEVKGFMVPQRDEANKLVARFTMPDWFPQEHNTYVFKDGVNLGFAKAAGEPVPQLGVVFFDEFMQADHAVQKPAADVLLNGRCGTFTLEKGWVTWAASNRTKDKSGTVKDLAFIQNRRLLVSLDPDFGAWRYWAENNDVHPIAIQFAEKNAEAVFADSVPDKDGPFCTPRSLVKAVEMLATLRPAGMPEHQLPTDAMAVEAIAGWIGEGAAMNFVQYAKLADELPDVADIISDPDGTKIPSRPDAAMLLCQMIAHAMKAETAAPLLKYTQRLPKEPQHIVINGALRRDGTLVNTVEFSKWAAKNQDMINSVYS